MSTSAAQASAKGGTASTDVPHGQFVWYDLMTRDQPGAIAFYTEVAGWGTQPWDGAKPYTMWTTDGNPLGGMVDIPPNVPQGAPPHWMAHVAVHDVDATVAKAKSLGGKVHHGPEDIPDV